MFPALNFMRMCMSVPTRHPQKQAESRYSASECVAPLVNPNRKRWIAKEHDEWVDDGVSVEAQSFPSHRLTRERCMTSAMLPQVVHVSTCLNPATSQPAEFSGVQIRYSFTSASGSCLYDSDSPSHDRHCREWLESNVCLLPGI